MNTINLNIGELGQHERPLTAKEREMIRKRDRAVLMATNTTAGIIEGREAVKRAKTPSQLSNALAYLEIAIRQDATKRRK